MFRPVQPFVTIITASICASGHYVALESGVECHLWAMTKARPLSGFFGFSSARPEVTGRLFKDPRQDAGRMSAGRVFACNRVHRM